ncbi:competence protein CoiA family protein [Streptomyces sp. NPDC086783]|uniref:competence protein CoiA family protein n=1 Tax=Streptomyces sp. NPDC086783 TaxID=3365758 RepID=UPI00381CD5FB
MAFLASHETWGTIDSTAPDLGCGKSWETVHRARPAAPLSCRECQHAMVPVRSPRGLHFFRHAPRAPRCSMLGGESIEHHLLKLELAHAARAAGFHAEFEVAAPDRSWRADVMATSPDGAHRVALEAQLSLIAPEDILQRTNRYERDNVDVCWFGLKPHTWVGSVPSMLLKMDPGNNIWSVSAGVALMTKLDPDSSLHQWVPVEGISLTDAVSWMLTGRMKIHRPRSLGAKFVMDSQTRQWPLSWSGPKFHTWELWWTTSNHIETDVKQHDSHMEQVNVATLRASSLVKAFRARTKIEDITGLTKIILAEFNNNVTRSRGDFTVRMDANYADGLAIYGRHWDGSGTMQDRVPLVVVCPDILGNGRYWDRSIPTAFPIAWRDRIEHEDSVWLFDLESGKAWPMRPKQSVVDAALASWKSAATPNTEPR